MYSTEFVLCIEIEKNWTKIEAKLLYKDFSGLPAEKKYFLFPLKAFLLFVQPGVLLEISIDRFEVFLRHGKHQTLFFFESIEFPINFLEKLMASTNIL